MSATSAETESLTANQYEVQGNVEEAYIEHVHVTNSRVSLRLSFDWAQRTRRVRYDLDDEEDVAALRALAASNGLTLEQASHLKGLWIKAVYTGDKWLPHVTDAGQSPQPDDSDGQPRLQRVRGTVKRVRKSGVTATITAAQGLVALPFVVARTLAATPEKIANMSTQDWIIVVLLIKKLLIAVAIVSLIL